MYIKQNQDKKIPFHKKKNKKLNQTKLGAPSALQDVHLYPLLET